MTPPPAARPADEQVRVMLGLRSGELCSFDTHRAEALQVAAAVRASWESTDPPGDLAVGTGAEVTTWLRMAAIDSVRLLPLPATVPSTPDPERPAQGEGGVST